MSIPVVQPKPKGSWINSARRHNIKDNILYAELYKIDRSIQVSQIRLYPHLKYGNQNGSFVVEEYNNTLFVQLANQLGNCLRIISSCKIIANYYKFNLFINITDNIQPKEKNVIQTLFPNWCIRDLDPNIYAALKYNDYVKYSCFYSTNYNLIEEGRFEPPFTINATNNNFAITETIYNIIPGNMTIETFIKEKIAFYKSIALPKNLLNQVHHFMNTTNMLENATIGFHIRYTDNLQDANKKIWNTSLEVFLEKINQIQIQFPKSNILICSDNQQIINIIRNLPSATNHTSFIFADKCDSSDFQAFYEMILLSKCKRIIGSSSSTFSYESAYIEGTDIELYENNMWKLYELSKYR